MALTVQVPDRHPLSVDAEGAVLPDIVLVPTADNVPHLRRILFKVSGQPIDLVQAVQAVLKDRTFKDPYRLGGASSLGKNHLKVDVPPETELELHIQVDYYDSDAAGKPPPVPTEGVADPKVKSVRGRCSLLPGCVIRVEPVDLQLMEGGPRATLRIQVERGLADARPRVRLKNPDALPHPQIRQKLLDLLNVVPTPVAAGESLKTWTLRRPSLPQRGAASISRQTSEVDIACFELPLQIQFSEEAKRALLTATNKGPLRVPLVTEVPGGMAEHSLFLKCHEKPHPGWVAIDFGTTNSTVTLFDPKVVAADKGLPAAQEAFLRRCLEEWLTLTPGDALPGVTAGDWLALLNQVGGNLGGGPTTLLGVVREGKQEDLFEALRQLEICVLAAGSESSVPRAATRKLQKIYHDTLRVPPLEAQQLVPIELESGRKRREVLSEVELEDLGPPVRVLMGERAKQDRLQSLATAREMDARLNASRRFHHSPKRYLGQDLPIDVHVKDQTSRISTTRLVQACWGHLLDLTDVYRQDNLARLSTGAFSTAVVTYPTGATPTVRREVERLVRDLGVQHVQTDYDEATSAAMFFLWQEFGDTTGVGLEAFKARSRVLSDSQWVQNVLVVDIGGGTTDLALIRLILEEMDPFQPGEIRGLGGRYYVIRPTLLGSAGRMHLGGELITLKLFLLLKAALADHLLTLVQKGEIACGELLGKIPELLDERFVDEKGKYRERSLLTAVEQAEKNNRRDLAALDAVDKVVPTRWDRDIDRLQAFFTLWEYADAPEVRPGFGSGAKIHLSRRREPGIDQTPPFRLSGDKVLDLVRQCGYELHVTDTQPLEVQLTYPQFCDAVKPVIEEAIHIADSLLDRVPEGEGECVDWLILSGKTCNLEMVEQEIRRVFGWTERSEKKFTWNPERVTFVPEYAKLATSIGACYAERMRRIGFRAEDSKPQLQAGVSQVDIDVRNLFVNLPCMFTREGDVKPLFKFGQALGPLDENPLFKARTDWLPVALTMPVYRHSTSDPNAKDFWGSIDVQGHFEKLLNWSPDDLREKLQVQFEVDHRLEIKLYFRHRDCHFHDVSGKVTWQLDLRAALSTHTLPAALPAGKGAPAAKGGTPAAAAAWAALPAQLDWDIAVNVVESAGASNPHFLFKQGQKFDRYFLREANQSGLGLISEPLPAFPRGGKHTLYARQNGGEWKRLDELAQHGDRKNPLPHRLSLDQHLRLRLHLGAVPYRLAASPEEFRHPGVVYRASLFSEQSNVQDERNPFCGRH
jgi:hypothetical protein